MRRYLCALILGLVAGCGGGGGSVGSGGTNGDATPLLEVGLGREVPLGSTTQQIDATLTVRNDTVGQAEAKLVVTDGATAAVLQDLNLNGPGLGVISADSAFRTYRIRLDREPKGPVTVELKVPRLTEADIQAGRVTAVIVYNSPEGDDTDGVGWRVADSTLDWARLTETLTLPAEAFGPDSNGGFSVTLRLSLLQGTVPPAVTPLLKGGVVAKKIRCPLAQGCIETSMFGLRANLPSGELRKRPHEGIDLRALTPTNIKGEPGGSVVKAVGPADEAAKQDAGAQVQVEMPDGSLIKYFHLSFVEDAVRACNGVPAGVPRCVISANGGLGGAARIGQTGQTGSAKGNPHLHLEVHTRSLPKKITGDCKVCQVQVLVSQPVDPFPMLLNKLVVASLPPSTLKVGASLTLQPRGEDINGAHIGSDITTNDLKVRGNQRFLCTVDEAKLFQFGPQSFGLLRSVPLPLNQAFPAPSSSPEAKCLPWVDNASAATAFSSMLAQKTGQTRLIVSHTTNAVEASPLPSIAKVDLRVTVQDGGQLEPLWTLFSLPFASEAIGTDPCHVVYSGLLGTDLSSHSSLGSAGSGCGQPGQFAADGQSLKNGYQYGTNINPRNFELTSLTPQGGSTTVLQGPTFAEGDHIVEARATSGSIAIDPLARTQSAIATVNGRTCFLDALSGPAYMLNLEGSRVTLTSLSGVGSTLAGDLAMTGVFAETYGVGTTDRTFQVIWRLPANEKRFVFTVSEGVPGANWSLQFIDGAASAFCLGSDKIKLDAFN